MTTLYTYLEGVESISPSSAGCSVDGGRAVTPYYLSQGTGVGGAVTAADLQGAITEILGTVTFATGDGRLNRITPLAHAAFPYWYASAITNIRGIGDPVATNAQPFLESPTFNQFALYPTYELTVEFTPRPYAVLQDSAIQIVGPGVNPGDPGTWYPETDPGTTLQGFTYTTEWERFTDFDLVPMSEAVSGQIGSSGQFWCQTSPPGNADPSKGVTLPFVIKQFLPNQVLRFFWYQVPFRYLSSPNSYLSRWVGRVNQNDWYASRSDGTKKLFVAGSLLYLGAKIIKRYTPPVQQEDEWQPGAFSTEKLCDFELDFIRTTRTAPANDSPNPGPTNLNYVVGGHNLQPWHGDRLFHFAAGWDGTKHLAPGWLSFPVEVLFTDPDFTQTVG